MLACPVDQGSARVCCSRTRLAREEGSWRWCGVTLWRPFSERASGVLLDCASLRLVKPIAHRIRLQSNHAGRAGASSLA